MRAKFFTLAALSLIVAMAATAQTSNSEGRNGGSTPTLIMSQTPLAPANPFSQPVSDQDVPTKDVVVADDQIVIGNLGVGADMYDGYMFSYKTIALRANNTRLYFDDSSLPGPYSANDWAIEANSNSSGGAGYLAFRDSTNGTLPFMVMAAAPTNSLVVFGTSGNVGFGTASPSLDLHAVSGNTPGLRLDQDASGGWPLQVWDVAGNEANFFIRDVTNASALPFRIQPGAPTSSLTIVAGGNVGIGTWTPSEKLEINGSMKLTAIFATPAAPSEGTMYMDANDHLLKYYDGTLWNTVSVNTDEQDLLAATLTGSILQIDIENGSSVSVDLAPLLADLEARVAALEAAIGLKENTSGKTNLSQNNPNPFIIETNIPFFIPSDAQSASIVIYDVKGAKILEYPIVTKGEGSLKINKSDLQVGSYFYSLILDGKQSESKIMIRVE